MRWIKTGIAIPYYAAIIVASVLWMSVIFPFAFLTDCSFTNKTESVVAITPIGTVGRVGVRRLLPLYRTSFPYFIKSQRGNFEVAPNQTFRFCYDMDDINFSEIVVRVRGGEVGQIVVNPNPTANQYSVPEQTAFILSDLGNLTPVPPDVKAAEYSARLVGPMWILYLITGILLVFETCRVYRKLSRNKAMHPKGEVAENK